jgi:hypothetical protein
MRSVYQLWLRNGNNTALQSYITSFAAVQVDPPFSSLYSERLIITQYNALTSLGSDGKGHYGPFWDGPPVTNVTVAGVMASVDLLSMGAGPSPEALSQFEPSSSSSSSQS